MLYREFIVQRVVLIFYLINTIFKDNISFIFNVIQFMMLIIGLKF